MRLRIAPFVLAIIIGLFGIPSFSPQAQQVATPYNGIDVVFLIDQSGSMGRIHGGAAPNDPLGLRFYGLQFMSKLMGDYRLLVNPQASFRMAVVNFGSKAEAWQFRNNGAYWQEISPHSRDEWNNQYAQLKQEFARMEATFSSDDFGETNFQAAFEEANTLFTHIPDSPGKRLRVIIVLTDGQPYVDISGFSVSTHMSRLQAYVQRNFPEPEHRIYTIGMVDIYSSYWNTVEPYWERITDDPCTAHACPDPTLDRAGLVRNDEEVGKRFQEILYNLGAELENPAGTQVINTPIDPGPVQVPPYLKDITFTYFKSDNSQHLVVEDPLHNVVDSNTPSATIEGRNAPIEIVRIKNPQPGTWKINTDPNGIDVTIAMTAIFAQSKLQSPVGIQSQFVPIKVSYLLEDEDGNPLPVYPGYNLQVEAEIQTGGQAYSLTLQESNGTYTAMFTPVLAQSHTIRVHAYSFDANGKSVDVYDGQIGTFDVSPVSIAITDLPTTWAQYREQTITLEVHNAQGQTVQLTPSPDIEVTISGEDTATHKLDDGTYETAYTPQKTGEHTLHVRATFTDSNGKSHVLTDADLATFNVLPTQKILLNIQQPQPGKQVATSFLPWKNTLPLIIHVRPEDDKGNPISPQDIFLNPDSSVRVTAIKDKQGNTVYGPLDLQWSPLQDACVGEIPEFGLGTYLIQVTGGPLKDGYLYRDEQATVTVERVRHPWYYPVLGGSVALLFLILAAVTWSVAHSINLRKHPCRGMIYIVDAEATPKFQKRLDSYGKNDITIQGTDIPPLTHIRKMRFRCESEDESKKKQVHIQVWLNKERHPHPDMNGRILFPGSEVRVGAYPFWIVKDPPDGELSEHPEAQGSNLD